MHRWKSNGQSGFKIHWRNHSGHTAGSHENCRITSNRLNRSRAMDAGVPSLQAWQGLSVTLDATPSSYDPRSQAWIFGLCIHTYSMGTLLRKGTITGMAPGPQSKARALFQGLLTLTQHVLTPVNVVVQLGSVWEAWTNPKKRQGIEEHLYQHITPLYIHKNTRTPEAPGNEPH